MPNRPAELYPLLRTLAPEVLGKYDSWDLYKQRYCGGYYADGKGASNIDEITASLQPFMLRRDLSDVWRECPPVIENTVWLQVPFRQHPEWIENGLEDATERRVIAEAKIPQIVAYVRERLELGIDKICVATYHRAVIEAISKELSQYKPVKIYGGVTANKRMENIAKFQQDPACRLFLMQIASAGEGLDGLQHVASELILAEPEWSPGREDQLIRRLMRLGQTKPVIYTKLLALDSYEDVIQKSNTRKRRVIDVVCKPNGGNYIMPSYEENKNRIANVVANLLEALAPLVLQSLANGLPQAARSFAPPQAAGLEYAQPISTAAPPPVANPFGAAPGVAAPPAFAPAAPIAAAPVAPTTPAASGPMTRDQFETAVLGKVMPQGQVGADKVRALCQQLGIAKATECPPQHYETFLANL
jgi:hypothetical protein